MQGFNQLLICKVSINFWFSRFQPTFGLFWACLRASNQNRVLARFVLTFLGSFYGLMPLLVMKWAKRF